MAEGVNMHTDMATGSDAVAETAVVERRSARWRGGGPLVRAVARTPVSVRTKHLVGFGVIVLLLVVVAAAGLLALSQSNSRGEQLRTEQQKTQLVQTLLAQAWILKSLVVNRATITVARGTTGVIPQPNAYYDSLDADISTVEAAVAAAASAGTAYGGPNVHPLQRQAYLQRFYPAFYTRVQKRLGTFNLVAARLGSLDGTGRGASGSALVDRQLSLANWLVGRLQPIRRQAQRRTNELAAENRSSFASSRNLVIGVTAGSIALAVALGLLISASLVVPLRRTDTRMAEIAAGDFTGHLEVPNRDEIGTLARNVNQMSDELGRVYRELETASRHKSDFLATMSHELRTPLNAIIGFSEVLHEQMFGELNERQLGYVDDVLAAGKHLLSLINDVLDLAKIEAGRMELELSQVAVTDVLRGAVSMYSERANRGGVELNLTAEPDEITITADERRLRQIVFNLLSNAVKFTPADGRIDVSARLEGGHVEVGIADTGPGIAAQDLETIFEEFEQTSEGKQAEGTGLGLPLSRKLVELHSGSLWAESTPGRGSTFRFTLPIRQEAS
jgi:signal transduction histidine kinase